MDWFNNLLPKNLASLGLQGGRIFLDYASATPVLPEVRREMEKYFSKDFYNPNAIYTEGERVKKEIEKYREKIAKLLGVAKESIIFTSGGTEANVLAIRGIKNAHVIIDRDSHPSVFAAAKGFNFSSWRAGEPLPLRANTTLVSAAATGNSLGRQVREARKKNGKGFPLLHIDASQTAQYFPVGLEAQASDMLSLDSAKLYGPKGIGALVVKRGVKLDLPPRGTPAVPLIAGFAKALEVAARDREDEYKRLDLLSERFAEALASSLPQAEVYRVAPNIVNISVPGILPELLVLVLDRRGIMVSAGPACNSNKPEPPETPVRFSLGRFTTEKELKRTVKIFCESVQNMLK